MLIFLFPIFTQNAILIVSIVLLSVSENKLSLFQSFISSFIQKVGSVCKPGGFPLH
jgi:hypothetical protein